MSTFEGKLLEDSLDFIRIDQFEPKNHNGTAFFLSHFHTDHFKGIFSDAFLKVLIENEDKVLYCTVLTKNLILRHARCRIPEHKIFAMTMNAPLVMMHEARPPVQVTALPAGHCPGSAMFLFDQEAVRVLYTGDFRINPNDLHTIRALHNSDGSVKKINTLYLDTTFCDTRWISFPSRKQTEEDLIEITQDWLESNPDHRVGILYNSYHGLEPLLMKLAKSLKTQINVRDPQSYTNYSCVSELDPWLCQGETDSRVHLCSVREMESCSECRRDRSKVRTIKPCAQSFDSEQLEFGRRKEGVNGLVRIAYSMHCSLEELIGTVQYLKPDVVYPCALPRNVSEQQVLKNLLLDVEKLKQELKEKIENMETSHSASPPAKRFCFSLTTEEEEEEEREEEEEEEEREEEEEEEREEEEEEEREEEETMLEIKEHTVISSCSCSLILSSDQEENKSSSQNFIDSPPL